MYRAWNPNFGEVIVASVVSVIGYYSPVKGIAHMLTIFFMIDIIFGYWKSKKADRKKPKEKRIGFSTRIIWENTVPRMVVTMVLLLSTFSLDEITGQDFVSIYRIVGWFIGALLIFSICKNSYYITNWKVLLVFARLAQRKVKNETGIDISEEDFKIK